MPNSFAYLMLLAWPLVALVLFASLPVHKALIWTLLGGYLVLPSATGTKLPMIPMLDKNSIPAISAYILCKIYAPATERPARPMTIASIVTTSLLVTLLIVSPLLTVVTNSEPVSVGALFLPGLRLHDALSMVSNALVVILPFLSAKRYLNSPEAHREILRAFAWGGLVYSLPAMLEVRLSPQLHIWIYGFIPSDFIQHIRAGGYRPIVFLNHGLMVGIFFCLSILAALTLWREARRKGERASRWGLAALWLLLTLVMVKSVGALAIAIVLGLAIFLLKQRLQIASAVVVASVVLLYPILRGAGLIPVDEVHDFVLSFSEDRAQSFKFRLDNEDGLLAHANEKPLAGWGGWDRNHLHDPETGRVVSTTDGLWILLLGFSGWCGYIAYFGLFTLPILQFARHRRRFGPSMITPGLILMLSAVLIDFLPNAGLRPYVWMITGAIAGFVLQPDRATKDEVVKAAGNVQPAFRTILG